jgi:ATP-dependent Lhr-like helicase
MRKAALAFVEAQRDRPVKLVRVDRVPPLSFAMYATKIKEAMLVEDPFAMQERLYHQWWSELQSDDPSEP